MAKITELKPRKAKNPPAINELVSFRLRRLTNMYTKASASVYEREFGLTLNEWRIIALLFAAGSLSMSRLAQQAQFDRGLTTRVVGALIERGLADRTSDPMDGRGVVLQLTPAGKAMVDVVAPVAWQRNEQLLSCLTAKEREVLESVLEKLSHQARVMLDLEREQALLAARLDSRDMAPF
jgi:DNA-binding MarR family transcriptional regulator